MSCIKKLRVAGVSPVRRMEKQPAGDLMGISKDEKTSTLVYGPSRGCAGFAGLFGVGLSMEGPDLAVLALGLRAVRLRAVGLRGVNPLGLDP